MTTLQDILGLITKRKIKTPSDNDYIISAAYTDVQEVLKPQPKMEASLLSLSAIKNYILSSIVPPDPPKYKVFTALLNQGIINPQDITITEMENTIGNITFQYGGDGAFYLTSDALFSNIDKCFIIMPSMMSSSTMVAPTTFVAIRTTFQNSSSIQIDTYIIENNGITKTNGLLYNMSVEIRIYN